MPAETSRRSRSPRRTSTSEPANSQPASQTANSQPATPGQPDIETALRQLNCQVAALTTAAAGIRAGTARLSNLNAETGRALEIVNGRILRAVGFRGPEVSVAIPAEAAAFQRCRWPFPQRQQLPEVSAAFQPTASQTADYPPRETMMHVSSLALLFGGLFDCSCGYNFCCCCCCFCCCCCCCCRCCCCSCCWSSHGRRGICIGTGRLHHSFAGSGNLYWHRASAS